VRTRIDYAEYGGAPLLGVNGVTIVAHGRSDARALFNAVRVARDAVHGDLIGQIAAAIAGAAAEDEAEGE
jgi:phosphate acyltransferase